jgi:hypothetical protein
MEMDAPVPGIGIPTSVGCRRRFRGRSGTAATFVSSSSSGGGGLLPPCGVSFRFLSSFDGGAGTNF